MLLQLGRRSFPIRRMMGKVDLSLTESAVAGAESVLALSEKWEQLTEFSESEPEREWSRAVGRLEILYGNTFGVCTAFLISETEILTNYHCIPGPGTPVRRATLRMGYYTYNAADTESYTVTVTPKILSRKLDVALLEVSGRPGETWGFLEFAEEMPKERDRLSIIHHPAGQVKHITQSGCRAGPAHQRDADVLLHRCDTTKGSSGSPLLNRKGQIVGLHYAGTPMQGGNPPISEGPAK